VLLDAAQRSLDQMTAKLMHAREAAGRLSHRL
jgi:hypothetical protein